MYKMSNLSEIDIRFAGPRLMIMFQSIFEKLPKEQQKKIKVGIYVGGDGMTVAQAEKVFQEYQGHKQSSLLIFDPDEVIQQNVSVQGKMAICDNFTQICQFTKLHNKELETVD